LKGFSFACKSFIDQRKYTNIELFQRVVRCNTHTPFVQGKIDFFAVRKFHDAELKRAYTMVSDKDYAHVIYDYRVKKLTFTEKQQLQKEKFEQFKLSSREKAKVDALFTKLLKKVIPEEFSTETEESAN
jgi:hypothetical protein